MANPTESNLTAAGDTFLVSRAAFQSIMDQLQRLDSEISTLKPQIEGLQVENQAVKREMEALRGKQREAFSSAPSASEPLPAASIIKSRSSSLSYVSEVATTPVEDSTGGRYGLNDAKLNSDDESEVLISEEVPAPVVSSPNTQPLKDEVTALLLNDASGTRRVSLRKRKVPTQADADWDAPQSHSAKKPRQSKAGEKTKARSKLATTVSPKPQPSDTAPEVSATRTKAERALSGGEPTPSSRHIPEASKYEILPTTARAKFPAKDIKANALKMDEKVSNQLLAGVPTLNVQPPPLKLQLPITLLQQEFGAATQGLLWHNTTKKGVQASNIRRFIYPGFDTNPEMPAAPGEPGLLLCGRVEMLDGIWSLFTRVPLKDSSLKRWNYAGEYESEMVGALSAQDFAGQPDGVKRTWGKKIAHHKKHLPYVEMRARMALRKEGKPVNKASLTAEIKSIKGMPKAQSKLSVQDVIDAFESGQESIPIVRMQCVTYNHAFAEELQTKFGASKASK